MRLGLRRRHAVLGVMLSALGLLAWPAAASSPAPTPIVVGIVLREAGAPFAMIQDPVTSRTRVYGVGGRVGTARVTEIQADRVILVDGGQQTLLRLATPVATLTGPRPEGADERPRQAPGPRGTPGTDPFGSAPAASPYGTIAAVTAGGGVATGVTSSREGNPAAIAGVGQAGGPVDETAGTQNGISAALAITGRLHDGSSQAGVAFSTTSLRDLLISMRYSTVAGAHRQRVELYAPDGSLYQRLAGAVAPNTRTLVPVGGTWITAHSLFGAWRVDVYVDRETAPIVSQTFTLTP